MTRRGSAQELRHAVSSEADHAALLQDDGLNRLTEGTGTSNQLHVLSCQQISVGLLPLAVVVSVFFETVTSHSFRQHVVV